MDSIRQLAKQLFNITFEEPSRSGGIHEISLGSARDLTNAPSQLPDPAAPLASFIDHTNLRPEVTKEEIRRLCNEANQFGFKSVCVSASKVFTARYALEGPLLCTVVGFPSGAHKVSTKVHEAREAIEDGADELDMVINIGLLKAKEYNACMDGIQAVTEVCHRHEKLVKVIIETSLLNHTEKIIACLLVKKAGADFVKTSTGFAGGGATVEDVALMREVVGPKIGVKASGGIGDKQTALAMIAAGANRLGCSRSLQVIS